MAFCAMAIHAKICRFFSDVATCDRKLRGGAIATRESGSESRTMRLAMGGGGIPPLCAEPEFCVVSRRNDSLGSRWRWRVFASFCVLSFALALGFAAFGAWMVLPYSALEMAVLYLAFRWFERRAADWERVSVCGDQVIVERECAGVRSRHEFNRYWVRVELEESASSRPPRLALRYAGRAVPFGDELPAAERASVARHLRRALAAR
jgi:uncharacterized membrane protein